jgi:hypothetical protein
MVLERQMVHMNNNILCAVNIRTGGPRAGYDDLMQIGICVLNSYAQPSQLVLPFYTDLQPKRPENFESKAGNDFTKDEFCNVALGGLDPYVAADRFDEWFTKLGLASNKRICPLAYDWPNTKEFLIDWLGKESVEQYFDLRYRDILSMALYANDKANMKGDSPPYPKVNLQYLCSTLKIPRSRPHDTLQNCVYISQIYEKMICARF